MSEFDSYDMFSTNTPMVGNNSSQQPISSNNLPPIADFGGGVTQEMRPKGQFKHEFVVVGVHNASKSSTTVTAILTKAPSVCKDIQLTEGFGCFQATTPQYVTPDSAGTQYLAEEDNNIRCNGGVRQINVLTTDKTKIEQAMRGDNTPAAFKEEFKHYDVAPQGSTDAFSIQFGVPIVKFHVNPGNKHVPVAGDTFNVSNMVVPSSMRSHDDKTYSPGGSMGVRCQGGRGSGDAKGPRGMKAKSCNWNVL